jgi:diguanylate cyclase (GGDEF)-like protein
MYFLLAAITAHTAILILSQRYGWFYYIDRDNIYHRGPIYILSVSVTVILLIAASAFIILNRNRIEKKYFFPLLFFAFPPFICIILQIIFYGISVIINSMVISLLIVFQSTHSRSIYMDYLTGLNNYMKLECYMKEKVTKCMINKTFSAIMIDLDNFKYINDTYGHKTGDEALQIYAGLLKSCLRSNDFIARYGGDEFCIVLDSSDETNLEKITGRINRCVENFNNTGNRPYKIKMSMGYAVYDYNSHMGAADFQKLIDKRMYADKKSKEKNKSISVPKTSV